MKRDYCKFLYWGHKCGWCREKEADKQNKDSVRI